MPASWAPWRPPSRRSPLHAHRSHLPSRPIARLDACLQGSACRARSPGAGGNRGVGEAQRPQPLQPPPFPVALAPHADLACRGCPGDGFACGVRRGLTAWLGDSPAPGDGSTERTAPNGGGLHERTREGCIGCVGGYATIGCANRLDAWLIRRVCALAASPAPSQSAEDGRDLR